MVMLAPLLELILFQKIWRLNNWFYLNIFLNNIFQTSIATVSSVGFRLVDKSFLFGPIAVFPKTTLSWRVLSPSDITPESLELFFMLQPKVLLFFF